LNELYPMTMNTKKKRKRFMIIDLQREKVKEALVTRKPNLISNNWLIK
jgi:hypothetical protein